MKTTTRASRAPGWWSVGMIRAAAASTVFHSCSVKNSRSVESGSIGSPTISHSAFSVMFSPSDLDDGLTGHRDMFFAAFCVDLGQVLGAAPGIRHHGERRVHAGG